MFPKMKKKYQLPYESNLLKKKIKKNLYLIWNQSGHTIKEWVEFLCFWWDKWVLVCKHIDNPWEPAVVQLVFCFLHVENNGVLKRLKLYWSIGPKSQSMFTVISNM